MTKGQWQFCPKGHSRRRGWVVDLERRVRMRVQMVAVKRV